MLTQGKKIGIFTCGAEPNYGACLQALATLDTVKEFGFSAELIQYSFLSQKEYLPFQQKSLKSFVASLLYYRLRKGIHNAFGFFRSQYMQYSAERVITRQDFRKIIFNYESILVGSDQVWSPYLGIDTNLSLLSFFESKEGVKKLSYSSSFGISELPDSMHEFYRTQLNDFSSISVRERSGAKIIEQLCHRSVPVTVDPVMLKTGDEWKKYETKIAVLPERYLLIYDMNHSQALMDAAKIFARENHCKILALSRIHLMDREIETLYDIGPGEFLYLIDHSSYVFTDSFHGTVFSILFHKDFYTHCGANGARIAGRLTNILDALNLESRLFGDQQFKKSTDIDYEKVDSIVAQMRNSSKEYLAKCLNR